LRNWDHGLFPGLRSEKEARGARTWYLESSGPRLQRGSPTKVAAEFLTRVSRAGLLRPRDRAHSRMPRATIARQATIDGRKDVLLITDESLDLR
jgi:hypothetical protein